MYNLNNHCPIRKCWLCKPVYKRQRQHCLHLNYFPGNEIKGGPVELFCPTTETLLLTGSLIDTGCPMAQTFLIVDISSRELYHSKKVICFPLWSIEEAKKSILIKNGMGASPVSIPWSWFKIRRNIWKMPLQSIIIQYIIKNSRHNDNPFGINRYAT